MNLRDKKGSISIFVLVALLFMAGFLIISVANNVNKSKTIKEQFNIISDIYAYTEGDEGAYDKAYTDLRKKNKQILVLSAENTSELTLTKAYEGALNNYRIYGNSTQEGTPTEETPVDILSVGENEVINLVNRGKNYINENIIWQASDGVNQTYSDGVFTFENTITYQGRYLYYYVTLKPGTYTYSVKEMSSSNQISISDANSSKSIASFNTNSAKSVSFTLSEETKIQIIGGYVSQLSTLTMTNVQLEEGSEVTDYEPYQKSGITLKLDEPLRKVEDYVDYLDYKTGKIVRNVGKIDSYNGETITTSWISTTGELSIGATVYYGLETAQEEYINLTEFKINDDDNKIEILTSVKPSRIELEYTGYTLD